MLEAFARIILRNRSIFLLGIIVLTLLMMYLATFVKLSYEAARILPATDSTYSRYLDFKKKFGEDGSVMVIGFQSPQLFKLDVFDDWYDLSNSIKKIDGIQEVVSIARCFHAERNDSLQLLQFKSIISEKPSSQQQVD